MRLKETLIRWIIIVGVTGVIYLCLVGIAGIIYLYFLENPLHNTVECPQITLDTANDIIQTQQIDYNSENVTHPIRTIAFQPNSQNLVVGGYNDLLEVWDTQILISQDLSARLQYPSLGVQSLVFNLDGTKLFEVNEYNGSEYWTFPETEGPFSLDIPGVPRDLKFSPDGTILAVANGYRVSIYNVEDMTLLRELEGHQDIINEIAFSPDGTIIASVSGLPQGDEIFPVDNTIRLWDVNTGQQIAILEEDNVPLQSVAYSPNGNMIAVGGVDGHIILWDTTTLRPLRVLFGPSSGLNNLIFSIDSKLLISANTNNTLQFWDVSTGETVRLLEGQILALNSSGTTLASGSADGTVRLWGVQPCS